MKKIIFLIIGLSLLTVGWFSHVYYISKTDDQSHEIIQIRENSPGNEFINPLILVSDNRNIEFSEYKKLKDQVGDYIKQNLKNTENNTSFYFRDLNSGEWVGVNEDLKYSPASMLKVDTLMAYCKLSDNDPNILTKKIHYNPTDISGQTYKPLQLKAGNYTVRELLQQMIVESDNDAMRVLNDLQPNEVLTIYKNLGLPDIFSGSEDFMSPKDYSRLFRSLYNGSYISHFFSNEALKLLTFTKFNTGIMRGVSSTTVAHKFGEYTHISNDVVDSRELSDCGIIYYPKKPYFICVMTKTKDQNFAYLENIISNISKITFDYVKSQK
jgi:beta-lactamase class A